MKKLKGKKNEEKDNVIQMNENGEIIDGKKKKSKIVKIMKKVAIGVGCAVVGIITFVAVGAAVAYSDGVDLDGYSSETPNDSETSYETESCGDSPEESDSSTEEA